MRYVTQGPGRVASASVPLELPDGTPLEVPAGADDPPPITLTLKGYGTIIGKVTLKGQPATGVTITATVGGVNGTATVTVTGSQGLVVTPANQTYTLATTTSNQFLASQNGTDVTNSATSLVNNPQGLGISRGYSLWGHSVPMDQVPNGYIFEVMTKGYAGMPSYSAQIPPVDRWKIIAYIRALQYTQHAPAGGKK